MQTLQPTIHQNTAQQLLIKHYGDPRMEAWASRWIISWYVKLDFPWFPVWKMNVHKDFCRVLKNAFTELESKGLHQEIKTFDGCFDLRFMKGSNHILSIHSWGCAIDLNAESNPLGTDGRWSNEFIETMTVNDIYCGQSWWGRKDPMHFAMLNG